MSIGSTPGNPTRSPEPKREIPLSWFVGLGSRDTGIISIGMSQEFLKIGDTRLLEYIDEPTNKSIPTERRQEIERKIKEITGFTVDQIEKKKDELQREFRGQKEAPFRVELLEIK